MGAYEWCAKITTKYPMRKVICAELMRHMDRDKGTDTKKAMRKLGVKATGRAGVRATKRAGVRATKRDMKMNARRH
jgi:hypothetical protein